MRIIKLLTAVLLTSLVGTLGGTLTAPAIDTWYVNLNKPPFTPPNWLFGPVWGVLYILMGISVFLIWDKKGVDKNVFIFYIVNLVLNFLWSFIFFGMKLPYLALLDIVVLWVSIIVLIKKFGRYSRFASFLLIPYLIWVSFASVLNFYIAILN